MYAHTFSELKKEAKGLQDKLWKEQSVARVNIKQMSQQLDNVKQESQRVIEAALEQHEVDLRR